MPLITSANLSGKSDSFSEDEPRPWVLSGRSSWVSQAKLGRRRRKSVTKGLHDCTHRLGHWERRATGYPTDVKPWFNRMQEM